jgi:hypothetical protein
MHNSTYEPRRAKTTYNLKQREYIVLHHGLIVSTDTRLIFHCVY